jgi:hypothetical protein
MFFIAPELLEGYKHRWYGWGSQDLRAEMRQAGLEAFAVQMIKGEQLYSLKDLWYSD